MIRRALIALGHLWTAPNTILWWLLAEASGCTWVFQCADGQLVYSGERSRLWRWWSARWGMAAITVGAVTIVAAELHRAGDVQSLLLHEQRHVYQAFALGPLYLPAYLLLCLWGPITGRHWYRDHPLERDARAHERMHR